MNHSFDIEGSATGRDGHAPCNVVTPLMTEVVRFRDGYAVVFDGRLASARWQERGPAEAQLDLCKHGYSKILLDGTIKHAGNADRRLGMTSCLVCGGVVPVNEDCPGSPHSLWDVLSWPTISKDNYCGSSYWEWEDNVCRPALETAGYVNVTFHMGERDSFGPLSRIVRAQKDGRRVEFIYG